MSERRARMVPDFVLAAALALSIPAAAQQPAFPGRAGDTQDGCRSVPRGEPFVLKGTPALKKAETAPPDLLISLIKTDVWYAQKTIATRCPPGRSNLLFDFTNVQTSFSSATFSYANLKVQCRICEPTWTCCHDSDEIGRDAFLSAHALPHETCPPDKPGSRDSDAATKEAAVHYDAEKADRFLSGFPREFKGISRIPGCRWAIVTSKRCGDRAAYLSIQRTADGWDMVVGNGLSAMSGKLRGIDVKGEAVILTGDEEFGTARIVAAGPKHQYLIEHTYLFASPLRTIDVRHRATVGEQVEDDLDEEGPCD